MKTDVVMPARPPKKRRVIEDESQVLDAWLAAWASDKGLAPSERARAQRERDRRKAQAPDVLVAVIAGREGITPQQRGVAFRYLASVAATEVRFCGRAGRALSRFDGPAQLAPDPREAVRWATRVIALPKDQHVPEQKEGVWDAVRFARHRGTPVTVVLPDGSEPTEQEGSR